MIAKMNLMFLGDIVGPNGCDFVASKINTLKKHYAIDITVMNGENSAKGNGISPQSADFLFNHGADIITTGNHCYKRKEIYDYFDRSDFLIRPANFPEGAPGKGVCFYDMGSTSIAFVNLMGTVYMDALDNPFQKIDSILEEIDTPNIFVDFHAEATSEKKAMGLYLAGRVTGVFGTHTHVQTSDAEILKDYTAYITDTGMCGPKLSVLGVKAEPAIEKLRTRLPVKFEESDEPCFINCVIVEFDQKTGKSLAIQSQIIS